MLFCSITSTFFSQPSNAITYSIHNALLIALLSIFLGIQLFLSEDSMISPGEVFKELIHQADEQESAQGSLDVSTLIAINRRRNCCALGLAGRLEPGCSPGLKEVESWTGADQIATEGTGGSTQLPFSGEICRCLHKKNLQRDIEKPVGILWKHCAVWCLLNLHFIF